MEYYLNEKYPYTSDHAIACFYEYNDVCIMQGVVNWRKELVITDEYHFKKPTKEEVAALLSHTNPWINKNQYFAQVVRYCYYLDFDDESDLKMLSDEFQKLIDNKRFFYEAEKTATKNRDKCLQILVKALSYSLNYPTSYYQITNSREKFANPTEVQYRNYAL